MDLCFHTGPSGSVHMDQVQSIVILTAEFAAPALLVSVYCHRSLCCTLMLLQVMILTHCVWDLSGALEEITSLAKNITA